MEINRNPIEQEICIVDQEKKIKIAVHFHIYYEEIAKSMLTYLYNIKDEFDLYITSSFELSSELKDLMNKRFTNINYVQVVNIGRDIFPFLVVLKNYQLEKYDVVLKLHTKKSPHRDDGSFWRNETLNEILGSEKRVSAILNTFKARKDVGAIGARRDLNFYSWGSNKVEIDRILKKINIVKYRLIFFAGSSFWVQGHSLDLLSRLNFSEKDFTDENYLLDGQLPHVIERLIGILIDHGGKKLLLASDEAISVDYNYKVKDFVKLMSFFLPQFHRIKENDKWWGEGFTEWVNVNRADKLFRDHVIFKPHEDIGEYNLLEHKTRKKQAELIREFDLYGLCYHYYWFNGKRLLEKPLDRLLEDGEPSVPFCLNWANEPWSRTWDGLDSDVLQQQTYGGEVEWGDHLAELVKYFKHPNYIKVHGAPVLILYRIGQIERYSEMIRFFKKEIKKYGFRDLKVFMVLGNFTDSQSENIDLEYVDGMVEFQPQHTTPRLSGKETICEEPCWVLDTRKVWEIGERTPKRHTNYFKGTFPSWDNTIRKGSSGRVYDHRPVEEFGKHLENLVNITLKDPSDYDNYIFINAWNEWAEGAILEPTKEKGYEVLSEIKRVMNLPVKF